MFSDPEPTKLPFNWIGRLEIIGMVSQIRMHIDPEYGTAIPLIQRTLEQLLEIQGWKSLSAGSVAGAHLIYGGPEHNCPGICVPPSSWDECDNQRTRTCGNVHLPAAAFDRDRVDWILAAAILLGGYPERQPGIEQHEGVPGKELHRWSLIDTPVVEEAANQLADRIRNLPAVPKPQPRWPSGRRWAAVLSHDVDRIRRHRTGSFFADAARSLQDRRYRAACGQTLLALRSVPMEILTGRDPLMRSWDEFLEFEQKYQTGGTYFVATWSRRDPESDPRDVHYRFDDPQLIAQVRRMHQAGFDIGLHTSINAWRCGRYLEEFNRFEQAFGFVPSSHRGHYWSLNPRHSARTQKEITAATGMTYCSTLGMNEVAGYRRGLCYPWRPFDHQTGESAGVWEVPPIMMDQSLMLSASDPTGWRKVFNERASQVRDWQGCFVLDWHTDMLAVPEYREVTRAMLDSFAELTRDPTCWTASLTDVLNWCSRDRWTAEPIPTGSISTGPS